MSEKSRSGAKHEECPGCEALRSAMPSHEPHEKLRLVWNDKLVPTVSVYYCTDCRSVLINNLADAARPWK